MSDMKIEQKGTKKLSDYEKKKFANEIGCDEDCLNKLDGLTTRIKSCVFHSKSAGKLVGNKERKYCGRYNGEKNIWVGAFFDTDIVELKNKLVVGFCVYDSTQIKPLYPKEQYIDLDVLHAAGYDYETHYSKDEGGYWYYVVLDDNAESFDVDKVFETMKKIIDTINSISRFIKKSSKDRTPSLWPRYFGKIITLISFVALFTGSVLYGKFCKKSCFDSALYEYAETSLTSSPIDDCPCCSELPCKTIERNVSKKINACPLFVLLILAAGTVALIVALIKDDDGLKFAKLDELHTIKDVFLFENCKISDQRIEEQLNIFEKNSGWEKTNKSIITKSSTKADLLKHYMTCVTEI